MKEITNIPKRILELMKKYNIKTDYKGGVMSIEERKFILKQILILQGVPK